MFASPTTSTSTGERRPHLAFGAGEHRCPGEGLSKLEQRIAAELFLRRMGNLRFTPDRNDFTHLPGYWLRALKELHVSFDPIQVRRRYGHEIPMPQRLERFLTDVEPDLKATVVRTARSAAATAASRRWPTSGPPTVPSRSSSAVRPTRR